MSLLLFIVLILFLLWLAGFVFSFGGALIHILLVVAVIVLVYDLVVGRRVL